MMSQKAGEAFEVYKRTTTTLAMWKDERGELYVKLAKAGNVAFEKKGHKHGKNRRSSGCMRKVV